jgi:hypothetical protein
MFMQAALQMHVVAEGTLSDTKADAEQMPAFQGQTQHYSPRITSSLFA